MVVNGELRNLSGPNVADLSAASGRVFSGIGAYSSSSGVIEFPDGTRESRIGIGATPGFFDALGVPLQAGQPWGPDAQGTARWIPS